MPRGGSIKIRLMIWGLALLGAALVLNTIAGSLYTRRQMQRAATALQLEMASLIARHVQAFIQRKVERLSDAGVAMSLYSPGGEEQKLLARLLLKDDQSFTELSVLDDRGRELIKYSERELYLGADLKDRSQSEKFLIAARGENYVGPVYTSNRAEPYVALAVPIRAGPHRIVGVLTAEAHLKFLWEVIGQSRFGLGGYAYIVDGSGNLIAHQDPSLVLKKVNLKHLAKVSQFMSRPAADGAPAQKGDGIDGAPVLSTFAPVADLGWAVIVEEPVVAALADARTMERYAALLLGLGLVVGAIVIAWVSNRITRPIRELRQGVAIVRGGNLQHRTHIRTGDEIEELAGEFNEMAKALEVSYSTLEQKVQQRTQEVSALYEVTSKVNRSLDLKVILDAVIGKVTEIFAFECTRVFLFNDQTDTLELRASFEIDPEHWTGTRVFKRGEGVVGRVAECGEPMIFEDVAEDPRYAALSATKVTQKARLRFFAVFPIKTQSRVFGVVLFNGRAPRKLTEDESRLLVSMSEQLGVAVERANLFAQSQTRAEHLAVLNMIGAAVTRSLNLEAVLGDAIERTRTTLAFDAAWIYMADPATRELHLKASSGLPDDLAQSMARRSSSAGISGRIFATGEPLVFDDFQDDPRYQQWSSRSTVRALGFRSSVGFPIAANEKTIGVLHLANKAPRRYPPDELRLIESIAQEIGVAAENARLFEQVNQKTTELAKINRDLEQANRAKTEFISAMSHELRTPLNVIMGNAELNHEGFFGGVNAEQKKSMMQIYHHSQFLLKLVNDVLTLSRLDAQKMTLELSTVDVDEIITHVQSQAEHLRRRNPLEVRWDVERDLPPMVTDATKLEEILQNLIGNAFKFTPRGRIDVRVRRVRDQDRIEFSVADTGIGIEAVDIERIFGAFEQIKEAHTGDFNGVGLGLNIVRRYLDLMKGEIRVESRPGEGTQFTFTVPRSLSTPAGGDAKAEPASLTTTACEEFAE
jgi:signal transduction histidine kinase